MSESSNGHDDTCAEDEAIRKLVDEGYDLSGHYVISNYSPCQKSARLMAEMGIRVAIYTGIYYDLVGIVCLARHGCDQWFRDYRDYFPIPTDARALSYLEGYNALALRFENNDEESELLQAIVYLAKRDRRLKKLTEELSEIGPISEYNEREVLRLLAEIHMERELIEQARRGTILRQIP